MAKNTINLEKILDDESYDNITSRVLGFCVMMSAENGGFETNNPIIAKFLSLTRQNVRTSLELLTEKKELEIRTKAKSTFIIVLKLDKYINTDTEIDYSKTHKYCHDFQGLVCLQDWALKEQRIQKSREGRIKC